MKREEALIKASDNELRIGYATGRRPRQPCLSVLVLFSLLIGICSSTLADQTAAQTAIWQGNTQYRNRDYSGALANYQAAVQADTNYPMAYNNLGMAHMRLGQYAESDAAFDQAKLLSTNTYVAAYLNKAKSLCWQGLLTDALSEVTAGLAISPEYDSLLYQKGWIEDQLGQLTNGLTSITAALTANPTNFMAYTLRGIINAKLGNTTNAVSDLYGAINGGNAAGSMTIATADYNLQLLRGPGVRFNSDQSATNYLDGLHLLSIEQYPAAISQFQAAQNIDTAVPDIPWMISWSYRNEGSNDLANAELERANALLNPLTVTSIGAPATIYIDGIQRGSTPTTLHLFPSQYDIVLRGWDNYGYGMVEWSGITYTDGTPGGTNVMVLNPMNVTNYTAFSAIVDADRDWLPDSWETNWFGSLNYGPQDDPHGVGLSNLRALWYSCNPNMRLSIVPVVKVNFAKPYADSLSLKALVDLGEFNAAGKRVTLNFGGEEIIFWLDPKGKGRNGPTTCSLKFSKGTGLWMFTSKWKSVSCQDSWSAYGLTNDTIAKPGRPVTMPVILLIGNDSFAVDKSLLYTARLNKSGMGK